MIRHLLRAWKVPPVLGCLSLLAAFVLPTPHDDAAAQERPSSLPRPSWTAPAPSTPALTTPPQPSPTRVQAGPAATQPVPTPSPTDPSHSRTDISASPSAPDGPTDSPTPSNPPTTDAATTPAPTATDIPTDTPSSGTTITARYTGYGWKDNDCGGPGDCTAYGDATAGGTGTWDDPVTVAVGADWLDDMPAGTVVYLTALRRYGVVEDRCGACTGAWVDVWVDGRGSPDDGVACMRSSTGEHELVLNPPADLPVTPGVISTSEGCAR